MKTIFKSTENLLNKEVNIDLSKIINTDKLYWFGRNYKNFVNKSNCSCNIAGQTIEIYFNKFPYKRYYSSILITEESIEIDFELESILEASEWRKRQHELATNEPMRLQQTRTFNPCRV